jgi:hypothetical protein
MTSRPEFDRLRQTCSTALEQFIIEAHKSELSMHHLSMPVSHTAARRFSSQRNAEAAAYENYISTSIRLMNFMLPAPDVIN